jgi:glycosyltransferase involved in cell wall biosynthesis
MPAHNEQDYLEAAVLDVVTALRDRGAPFEVIVAENGSTDDTAGLARILAQRWAEVRVISAPRADYGEALRAGFLEARGDVVANFDVDYVDISFLDAAVSLVTAADGPAVVVASKRGPGAHDNRSVGRQVVTATFSGILRIGFGLGVSDTHGMKVMRRADLLPLVRACQFGADLFDTELILRAERAGLGVTELPVTVRDTRPPRSSILTRIPRSLAGLVRLRLALRPNRPAKPATSGEQTAV